MHRIYFAAPVALLLAGLGLGWFWGSDGQLGRCDCCSECHALGVYWPVDGQPHHHARGWHRGPLPKDTWNYGAITLRGCPGFYYADFKGSYVMASGYEGRPFRVEARDVAWWNNDIKLPARESGVTGSAAAIGPQAATPPLPDK